MASELRNTTGGRWLGRFCVSKVLEAAGGKATMRTRGESFCMAGGSAYKAELIRKKNAAVLNFFIGCQSYFHVNIAPNTASYSAQADGDFALASQFLSMKTKLFLKMLCKS